MATEDVRAESENALIFKASKAIVDTSALIKAPLDEICKFSETLYTVEDVLKELRDTKTKHKLAFVPNYLKVLTPSENSYNFVCEFSRKAGCYQALSVADLRVMALTHQLYVETCGSEGLKSEPTSRVLVSEKKKPDMSSDSAEIIKHKDDAKIPGFYVPGNVAEKEDVSEISATIMAENDNSEEQNSDESEEDDDSGWITKDNLRDAQRKMERLHCKEEETNGRDEVACVTLDYTMQRVLQQIGITIMSVDGVKLSNLKSYVLRCYACMAKTPNVSKVFCPECGLKTLKRLFYSIDDNGEIIYHFSKNYVHSTRGLKYHVPRPQGGKHGQNPWVAEDQRFPLNQAPKKNRTKNMPLDPDYIATTGPFTTRDTHSRYFNVRLGSQQTFKWMQKNPNENKGAKSKRR